MGGRRYSAQRLGALFALVAMQLGKDFTVEKALWVLFNSDTEAYRQLGQSITGATWVKTAAGPLPMSKKEADRFARGARA